MSRRQLLLAAALIVPWAGVAESQWTPNGVPVCVVCQPDAPLAVADGLGGIFVTWRDSRDLPTTDTDTYLQRITAAGAVAAGWPASGFPASVVQRSQEPFSLALDGTGGVLMAWDDLRNGGTGGTSQDIYAQRIRADGMLPPGWPVNGAPVTRAPDYQTRPAAVADGGGGALIAWVDWRIGPVTDIYAQHLTASGGMSSGWPEGGLPTCTAQNNQGVPIVLADGEGGMVAAWGDERSGDRIDIYAQRVGPDGTIAPGWMANGLPLLLGRAKPKVAPAAAGFYVGCSSIDPNSGADAEYYVQRFEFTGARATGWPEGGVRVCGAPSFRDQLQVAPDGTGGLVLAWIDYRPNPSGIQIYAARVLATGALAPGWTADGVRVSDVTLPGNQFDVSIASDGHGGVYLAWEWEPATRYVWVQHLTAIGAVAPGWPRYGLRVSDTYGQFDPVVVSDGASGAIVVWEDRPLHTLFAQRYVMDGVVPAQVSLVSTEALPDRVKLVWHAADAVSFHGIVERRGERTDWKSLGAADADGTGRIEFEDRSVAAGERYAYRLAYSEAGSERRTSETWVEVPRALILSLEGLRPNPAVEELSASFTLPSSAPARLALLDVGGRVVIEREVGAMGAGRHLLRLGHGHLVPSGIYWLNLSQGGQTRIARGVVIR